MDKYEYKVRADEIKELISQGEFAQAAEIADTIDWRRVKSVMMLCTISDLYKINRRFEDARDMLLLAYERRPGGRTICYSLCELSIKMEEFVQAVEYYKEFVQVAPKDPGRYILQYKLYEAQDVSLEERIQVLEELKKRDYREKWAYELAYLYHRVGLSTQCVEECDELILWFGEGKYVIKAMELKMLHEPLSPDQQYKYDHRMDIVPVAEQIYGTESQAAEPDTAVAEENAGYEAVEEGNDPAYENEFYSEQAEIDPQEASLYGYTEDTQIYEPVSPEMIAEAPAQPEEMEIHVKTMDVGQYNTINLQAELAEGLKEVLASEKTPQEEKDRITRAIMEPMLESDTESLDYPQIEEVEEEDLEDAPEEIEGSEVFFGETGEISSIQPQTVPDITAEIVLEQMRQETAQVPEEESRIEEAMKAEPPKELAKVLSQESDGQISLVVPESTDLEKQITGQMSIQDILAEWERMKKENEEKRKEEVRQHVLQQTGSLFNEFEASVRDGLLEKLENGEVSSEELEDAANEALAGTADETEAVDPDIDEVEELEEIAEVDPVYEVSDTLEETIEAAEEEIFEEEETFEEGETEEAAAEEVFEEEIHEEVAEEALEVEPEYEDATETAWENPEELPEDEQISEEMTEEDVLEEETFEETAEAEDAAETAGESSEEEVSEEVEVADSAEAVAEETEAPQVEAPQAEAVERERPQIRALTREEKELYAPFIQSRSAREQLVQAIDSISMAAYTGNLIITGEEGMDTLTLAKNIIRELQVVDSNFSGKVAKITGSAFNSKEPAKIAEQLMNGALIIQNASSMDENTTKKLYRTLQQENLGIVVILEDAKKAMNKFLEKYPELKENFNARMDVEALSNDTLVAFGKQYAREREYSIDELGILALHTRIEDKQTLDHAVTVVEVKEIVDEAIRHANRKNLGHFLDVLFARRYDEEDMIILSEKDFA